MTFLLLALPVYINKLVKINYSITVSILVLAATYFGAYSYALNKGIWHDEESFFMQEIIRFENNYYAYGYAVNLLNKKEYRKAETFFRIAIKHYSDQVKNYINYSALLIKTGQPNAALSYLNKAKSLTMTYDQRGEWLNNAGMACFQLNKYDNALEHFRKAVHFSPEEPQYWANLGGAYGSVGDYINSILVLRKGLKISPESVQLRKNLAVTYIRMEDYEKAISVLEKIPRKNRDEFGINALLLKAQKAQAFRLPEIGITDQHKIEP